MQVSRSIQAIFFMTMTCLSLRAMGQNMTIEQYVATYKNLAIIEMQRAGVPASITLAQGILETEGGNSDLLKSSNNHFGIKCKSAWTGATVTHDDDALGECFRKYDCAADSYKDHSAFLKGSDRYAFLFQLDPLDYKGWANGLKRAGYATNPKYAQILIQYIEQYHLQDYSMIAMGKMSDPDAALVSVTPRPMTPADAGVTPAAAPIRYPQGEFKINETRVVYAAQGTSLLALADQYHISLSYLVDFNDLKDDNALIKDQLVFLQRKRKIGGNQYHTVSSGETLYGIAQSEGIRLSSLLDYNQLSEVMQPAVGESLYLQENAPARPKLSQTASTASLSTK